MTSTIKQFNEPSHKIIEVLHKNGTMYHQDMLDAVPGLTWRDIDRLRRCQLLTVKGHEEYRKFTLTRAAYIRFNLPHEDWRITPGVLHRPAGTYMGEELRPFTNRAGANDAFKLPSKGFGT